MAQSIDFSTIASDLGAYCRDFKGDIFNDIYLSLDKIDDRMMVDANLTAERPLLAIQVADIVKPANSSSFSGTTDAIKVGDRLLTPRGWKVDLILDYQKLWNTWLFHYGTQKPGVPTEQNLIVPFHQYCMAYVAKRTQANLRKALFQGVYNGAGTTPVDVLNGVKAIVDAEIIAGNLVAVANTNGVGNMANNIAAVHASLGLGFQDAPTVMLLGSTYYRDYIKEVGTGTTKTILLDGTKGKQTVIADAIRTVDGFENCEIKHEPLLPANAILCTTKDNMCVGFDSASRNGQIRIQEFERTLKVMIDGAIGFNFHQTKWLNSNEKPVAINDKW